MTEHVNPRSLLSRRRMDIPVKWRYFRHLITGEDKAAQAVYLWHIGKRIETNQQAGFGMDTGKSTPQDYVDGCRALLKSMQDKGYDKDWPIPVAPDGEILGGAHRLAAALAIGLEMVPVQRCTTEVTAPMWGFRWFWVNGMWDEDRHRLIEDWEALCQFEKLPADTNGAAKVHSKQELKPPELPEQPTPMDIAARASVEGARP